MSAPKINTEFQLIDSLTSTSGRVFLTGTQALVRMLLAQRRQDRLRGLNTAGFVTGYRGSPLGGVDIAMWRYKNLLDPQNISFMPSINEDLGATIIMGTQQAGVREDRKVDGVFGLWYGKGPGVDRAGDALHHGNAAGASKHGGVLLIVGDDHTAASSSIPHASDTSLSAWSIPVIHPASVEEYELFGLWGWALSRYSGTWVAFKAVTETVESGRSFTLQEIPDFSVSTEHTHPGAKEYSAREFLTPAIENTMAGRLQAVKAFSALHSLDRLVSPAPEATLGIVSTGKAYLDTLDALERLAQSGVVLPPLRHYKIGLSWPIDQNGLLKFVDGLEHVLVIEEKAPLIENQIKDILFNHPTRPSVAGKHNLNQQALVPSSGQLSPSLLVPILSQWLGITSGLATPACMAQPVIQEVQFRGELSRKPYFCSGCPHSTSTKVPEGSQALAGVGCHYMATWMDRSTSGLTQMGGEGSDWIGLSRYTTMGHVFQNMGEGTYFHSGYLAIRQAIAANANITYKILFNDAVAMTGGQPVDGSISVPQICQQMLGEGVRRVVITTDDPKKYQGVALVKGVTIHHRHELDSLQRELREIPGVTILIHDQVCAAEKRRRRKKKTYPDPPKRLFINTAVCEGCGDCSTQSNCLSLTPVETPFGRKRAIDQSSCNKDYTCVDGFCPSFVSVLGGSIRKGDRTGTIPTVQTLMQQVPTLPQPVPATGPNGSNILVAGIGGTGVITVGAILSMAAHLEGCAASVLDITGLAQKGGTVISHVRLSNDHITPGAVRIDPGQADVAIFCDVVAGSSPEALNTLRHGQTSTVLNTYLAPTSEFTHNPHISQSPAPYLDAVRQQVGNDLVWEFDAHTLASNLFGDSILSNMMMLGYAWQRGTIPLSLEAIMQALDLNGVAVAANQQAFQLGRLASHAPDAFKPANATEQTIVIHAPESLEAVLARCIPALTAWQNAAYAKKYADLVDQVLAAELTLRPTAKPRLTVKAAQSLYKLMAYKDEYEVARLFTNGDFRKELSEQFEGDFSLQFHMAPPLLARHDPHTGIPRKITLGPSTEKVLQLLAKAKFLRGTWLDVFSYTTERKLERQLIRDYIKALKNMSLQLNEQNYPVALQLADLPLTVRGYGHIKLANIATYQISLAQLQAAFITTNENNTSLQLSS